VIPAGAASAGPAPFLEIRYLEWVRRFWGRAEFDLGVSGALPPPKEWVAAMEATAATTGAMPDDLNRAIARFNGVDATEVTPAIGASQALWLAYATTLFPGDLALVEAPAYEPLVRVAESTGARVATFERSPDRQYRVDVDAILGALTPRTRIVALSNLHNPSGCRTSDADLTRLAAGLASRGTFLMIDEVYAPFDELTVGDGTWGKSARRLGENVIAVGSLTKGFGLSELRVGWLLGPKDIVDRANRCITLTLGHLGSAYRQRAAAAFANLEALAERSRMDLGEKRRRVAAWMESRSDLSWSRPASGLFGFALSRRAGDLTSAIEAGLTREGVIAAPGAFFGVSNGVRVAWALPLSKLDAALERLGRVLPSG
jgi:aspartate/methionine/tyrosine aminotransferase